MVFLTVNILENAARINWLARLPSNRREFSLILLQIGKGCTLGAFEDNEGSDCDCLAALVSDSSSSSQELVANNTKMSQHAESIPGKVLWADAHDDEEEEEEVLAREVTGDDGKAEKELRQAQAAHAPEK